MSFRNYDGIRVVQIQPISFLKSLAETVGSDLEQHLFLKNGQSKFGRKSTGTPLIWIFSRYFNHSISESFYVGSDINFKNIMAWVWSSHNVSMTPTIIVSRFFVVRCCQDTNLWTRSCSQSQKSKVTFVTFLTWHYFEYCILLWVYFLWCCGKDGFGRRIMIIYGRWTAERMDRLSHERKRTADHDFLS